MTINDITNQYKIVCSIDLNRCEHETYNWLFQQLQHWDHAAFAPDERILLTYSGSISLDLLSHVQRVINLLDITNLFVLIATNDQHVKSKIDFVTESVSTDQTCFNFVQVELNVVVSDAPVTNFSLPKTICLAPWGRLDIKVNGGVAPCCDYNGSLLGEDGVSMKVTEHSLEQIYFSKELSDLRKSFLLGNKPEKCSKCWTNETSNIKSMRQHHAWDLQSQQYNIDFYNDTTKNIKIVHSALGNVCNLRCRTCLPLCSSKLASEAIKQLPKAEQRSNILYSQLKQKRWVKNHSLTFWDEYLSLSKDLIEISFTGGEPMLIDQQFELVKKIAEQGTSKKINLQYTTNGTTFPDEILDYWKLYKKISITVSVDDIGKRFEYQRYGAKWEEVRQNVVKYRALKGQLNFELKINSTINILNIWSLPELCAEIEDLDVDFARLNVLHFPEELSIRNLPTVAKTKLIDRLSNATYPKLVESQIKGIINFIKLTPNSVATDNINNHIRRLDVIRNQNFSHVSPEMANLLNYQK